MLRKKWRFRDERRSQDTVCLQPIFNLLHVEEVNSRPQGSYVYCALIELCRPGETDESKIIATSAALLHVRLGKNSYRGVKDDEALTNLRQELSELLEEVRKNGFDAYCAE